MATVHPVAFSIAVIPSEVDPSEEQRPSGLLVKQHAPKDKRLSRGVIAEMGDAMHKHFDYELGFDVGDVVYYRNHWEISDVHIVNYNDIVAWESNEG